MKRWYFICACGAKFFNRNQYSVCPRCEVVLVSGEQLSIPWRTETVQVKLVDKKCLFCETTEGVVLAKNKDKCVAVCAAMHLVPLLKKWETPSVAQTQTSQ